MTAEQIPEPDGEHMADAHLQEIKNSWLETTIANVNPLIPKNEEFGIDFESADTDRDAEGKRYIIPLELEHVVDKHGNRKRNITLAAAGLSLAGLGIGVLLRGRISPKSRKK